MQVKPAMLAFLGHGFSAYTTITLWCSDHGFIRVNIPNIFDEAPTEYACPMCGKIRTCGILSVIGVTRRPLPAFDVVIAPISDVFRALTLESFDEPALAEKTLEQRRCEECGDRFQPRHGNARLCSDLCSSVRASRRQARRYAAKTATAAVTAGREGGPVAPEALSRSSED